MPKIRPDRCERVGLSEWFGRHEAWYYAVMPMAWTIASWTLWGLTSLVCAGLLLCGHRDGGVRFMLRMQGLVLALGLLATVAFPVSKFHLLWIFPVAFVTPMVAMQIRVATNIRRVQVISSQQRSCDEPAPSESLESLQTELSEAKHELQLLENPETLFTLGHMAYEGDEVPQSYAEAAGWWKMAAEQNHVTAAHNLGLMYDEGEGVPQDFAEAAKWYRKAAEQGHAGSQNNLGTIFERGDGVARDEQQALSWYRKAAANGDANAVGNAERLQMGMKRDECNELIDAFVGSILPDGPPLIGDCARLPHPKHKILYAIRWMMDYYETVSEETSDDTLRSKCQSLLPTLGDLFTRLSRDWHKIDAQDMEAVAQLRSCKVFPEWASPLKAKYINEERALEEATEIAFQVISDRADPAKRRDDVIGGNVVPSTSQ